MNGKVVKGRRLHYALNAISNIAVIAILIITLALVGLRLFGFSPYTVLSGSMEPNYPVGSLIYTHAVDPTTLQTGDIITFMSDQDTIVTHRIVEVVTETSATGEQTLRFRTQGDANNTPDGRLVHPQNILGTPSLTIPYLGYLAFYLQRPPGIYIALVLCTFLISLVIIPSVIKHQGKEQIAAQNKA